MNEEELIKGYIDKTELYKENLFSIQTQISDMYSYINEKNMNEKVEKGIFPVENTRPKTALNSVIKP
jgi:hypothetical protein